MLSAAGIGALLSPPTLGAAAFLIAEFLQISYLQVLVMATIPTLLYYLSIFLMIEADTRLMAFRGTRRRGREERTAPLAPNPCGAGLLRHPCARRVDEALLVPLHLARRPSPSSW